MQNWLSRFWKRTSSASPNFTLSIDGKKALLIGQIQQLGASIYLESVKRELTRRKALTDRNQSREFAQVDHQLRGRINAMKAEREHMMATYDRLCEGKDDTGYDEAVS